jgi:oligoendopeptidase F
MEAIKERGEIAAEYKWHLEDIFPSREAWDTELTQLQSIIPEMAQYRGKLNNYDTVLDMLNKNAGISLRLERVFVYARMSRDTNNSDPAFVEIVDKAMSLMIKYDELTSYIQPELNLIENETLLEWATTKPMEAYDYFLREIQRNKPHVLSDAEERLLALSGEMADSYDTIFTMLSDVDMQFQSITDEKGEKLEMSHGRYSLFLENPDREVRKQAFESMYQAFKGQINTVASLYSSSVKKDIFYARARKFEDSRIAELFGGNIPLSVYDGLIDAVHKKLPVMHRYVRLRKKLLDLPDLKMYDMYVPMFKAQDVSYTYLQAKEMVLEALAPLGTEYNKALKQAYESGWVDVFESKGKTSGAYAWGAYDVHPYILLNHQNRLDDVFTLAHESGHALHTYFSNLSQPYSKAGYRIFVAEVASTVNEVLMLRYMLNKNSDVQMKKFLLEFYLEQFRTTLFRQTMFAEFEMLTHQHAEKGESLTPAWMNETYAGLNRSYYGDAVDTDEFISYEWARIPHFYRPFYVYQYATGFSAAVAIAKMILAEGEPAVKRYMSFLSGGGSDSPIQVLKRSGVDLSKPEPVLAAMETFEQTLTELESLLD